MLVKILGAIDFLSGLFLLFGTGLEVPNTILMIIGITLLVKSFCFGFLRDFASWIDFCGGIVFFILIFFSVPVWISIIIGILVLQKGIFSFL